MLNISKICTRLLGVTGNILSLSLSLVQFPIVGLLNLFCEPFMCFYMFLLDIYNLCFNGSP